MYVYICVYESKMHIILGPSIFDAQEKILLEQEMATALRAKDYRKAVMLAFELKQPFRLLQVIDEVITQREDQELLDSIVARFTDEQVCFQTITVLSCFILFVAFCSLG